MQTVFRLAASDPRNRNFDAITCPGREVNSWRSTVEVLQKSASQEQKFRGVDEPCVISIALQRFWRFSGREAYQASWKSEM